MDKKILWVVVIIVVIAAAAVYYLAAGPKGVAPEQAQAPSAGTPSEGTATEMQPTANPDVIVSGLLQDTSAVPPTPAEADPTLLNANSQTINDFDQSLNTSQF